MKHWLRNILILTLWLECKGEDRVIQPPEDVIATEGETVTLECKFETSDTQYYLFWYKQDGNNSPKFILSRFKVGTGKTEAEFKERFSATLNSTSRSVPLKIQKLQLSDSAVYYCALRPDFGGTKMIFGSGTRLTIEPKEEYEPSYYKVGNDSNTACLATGFSRHNASIFSLFNTTNATLISGDKLYNQVALLSDWDKEECEKLEKPEEKCEDTIEPDPMVNLMALTIMGLRLLFLKTIVFNVLMTFRLWISQ